MKRYCRYKGVACEYATEYGYCQLTGCAKRDAIITISALPSAQPSVSKTEIVGDVISRQAALDYVSAMNACDEISNDAYQKLTVHFENLPSAQTEPEEFEWCHTCREYDQEKHCCHRWTKVIRKTVDEMKAAQPGWIPCSERMPDEKFGCLVTIYRDNYFSGEHNVVFYESVGWDGETWNDCFGVPMDDEVVAWMPLPEPWEGGQDNG